VLLCGGLLSLTGGNITPIAGRTFLIFGDIEEKLDVLRVECTKCTRKGCYRLSRLIEKYGRKGNMMRTASATARGAMHVACTSAAT
jgi:hypothetical protein